MAHLVETMAYAGEVPWHGLGKRVLPDLTPDQMLKEAGLDWSVDRIPAYCNIDGSNVAIGRQALVRSSDKKVLTVISDDWEPVQNSEAFDFFHEYIMEGDMEMHTAGSLKGGNVVWALAKVKESFELFGGDQVDSYLLFSNPHEYGKCIDIRFTPIRVVCNNTLTLSLAQHSDKMIRLNHRRKFNAEDVKETLGIAKTKLNTYKEMAEFLGTKRYTKESLSEYFRTVFPSLSKAENDNMSRPAQTALSVIDTQPGADFARGSWWSAFNASTFTIDHVLGRSTDTRLTSAWYGQNRQKKIKALETAVDFAEAA